MTKHIFLYFIFITLLTACGGGSDADNNQPTPEPAPLISNFTASKTTIMAGETIELFADFSNGTASIDNGIGAITSGTEKAVTPEITTIYTLTVTNDNGVFTTQAITVEVVPLIIDFYRPDTRINPVENTRVAIWVDIESEFEVADVIASIGDITVTLEFESTDYSALYGGAIYLTDKPPGEYTLTVTATDIFGASNTATTTIILDTPPVLAIVEPIGNSVATPQVSINLSCNDDVSDTDITIKISNNGYDGEVLTSGVNQIKGLFDLSSFEGQANNLLVECRDSASQKVTSITPIYIETSNKLSRIKNFSGTLSDYDDSRALVHKTSSSGDSLTIADINSDSELIIEVEPNSTVVNGRLTPTGAIYQVDNHNGWYVGIDTFDWNNGELINLGKTGPVHTAGSYISFIKGGFLWQRNLTSKVNSSVSEIYTDRYGDNDYSKHDVAKNGVVVFHPNAQWSGTIRKYEDGTTSNLTSWGHKPLTDGTLSIYKYGYAIAMHDGNNEIILTDSYDYDSFDPEPHTYYAVNNGWVAYTDLGSTEQTHVWTRDTQGTLAQRTFFSSDSLIDTLADNGELMLIHDNKRYLSKPNEELILIGSSLGKSKYINDKWYIAIGRTLFLVTLD